VSGVVITAPSPAPASLPRTGFDPGILLMLGGGLVVAGVLMMRYADDRS
jgi:hypothetical protein